MNLAVKQDPRDHDPGHPRTQNKELFSFYVFIKFSLFGVYKYLICKFYIAPQIVTWYFAKL